MFTASLNTSSFNKSVSDFRRRLSNLRPFFQSEASNIVHQTIERVFETEGYGTWAPLDPGYASWKASRYPGQGILRREGTYFRAATTSTTPQSYRRVDRRSLQIGVQNLDFALFHERGTGRLPRRSVFWTASEKLETPILQSLNTYLFRRPTRR